MNDATLARRLARRVAFAVRVDPPLLRRARLELLPEADAGTEADVWFLPEVEETTASGFVFSPEAAEALRRELAAEGEERYEAAWELTRQCHAALSPALLLEEEVRYLAGSRAPEAPERIRRLLRSALAALVAGDRRGLARWAARALPRFPDDVRRLEEAEMLGTATDVRLTGHLGGPGARAHDPAPEWLAWVGPVARVAVGIRLLPGVLEVRPVADGGPRPSGLHTVELPETDPLVLDIEGTGSAGGSPERRSLRFRPDEIRRVRVPAGALRLRSVLGEEYRLEPGGAAADVLDFEQELAAHLPLVLREEELARIEEVMESEEAGWILVVGERGAGKTALLAEIVRTRQPSPPHHFFRRDLSAWADAGRAARSLAAQLQGLVPETPETAEAGAPPDLASLWRRLLELEASGAPPVVRPEPGLVVDGLDEVVDPAGPVLDVLLPRTLPRGMFGLVTLHPDSPAREWFEAGGQVVEVLELEPPADLAEALWAIVDEADLDSLEPVRANRGGLEMLLERLDDQEIGGGQLGAAQAARLLTELARFPRPFARDGRLGPKSLEELRAEGLIGALLRWEGSRTGGDSPARRALGVLAAAREAIPAALLAELLGASEPPREIEPPLGLLLRRYETGARDGGPAWTVRSEEIREAVVTALGEAMRREHQVLSASVAAWPADDPSASPERAELALRHALFHATRAGDLDRAGLLATDPAYLAARCALGVDALVTDLEELRSALESSPDRAPGKRTERRGEAGASA